MKLICTLENFKKAIHDTQRVVSRKVDLPILNNILLETKKGRLEFSATNLEIGIISKIGAKIEKKGKITIPAKLISDFILNLPLKDKLVLEVKDNNLINLTCGQHKANIKGLSSDDFPLIPTMKKDFNLSFPANALKDAILKVMTCASVNNSRPELVGVNLIFSEKEISFAATDSFRLAEEIIPLNKDNKINNYEELVSDVESVIIPFFSLSELVKLIDETVVNIFLGFEDNQIFFKVGDTLMVSRLISAKYPDYKQIIPQKFNTEVIINKQDLTRSVKIASLFVDNKVGEITFSLDRDINKLVVKSQSAGSGVNESELNVKINGDNQKITFNPRYVLEGLNTISRDEVALLLNSESSPAALREFDDKKKKSKNNYIYIIMPITN